MSTSITGVKQELINLLSLSLHDVRIIGVFPSQIRENPIQSPIVSVGVASVEIASSCMDNYYGQDEATNCPIYGKLADVTLSFTVCTPPQQSSLATVISEQLTSFLLFENIAFDVKKIICKPLFFERSLNAFILEMAVDLQLIIREETIQDNPYHTIHFFKK